MTLVKLQRAAWGRMRTQSGAFDLPSIMIGVAVVAILTVGVLAAIFGVIPWSQDNAAKQDLNAVVTAQGVAMAKDFNFLDKNGLSDANYITTPEDSTDLAISALGDPYQKSYGTLVAARSTGKHYVAFSTSKTGKTYVV